MNKKTVGNLIAAAVVCMTGTHAVADVVTDMITSEAVFWFDASTLTAAAGTELDSWADVRGGSYPTFTTYTTIKPQVIEIADGPLAGKKAVTFFTVGTKCDMQLASRMQLKTAFFVTDIEESADAYLLGDSGSSGNYYFARGTGGNNGTVGSYQYKGVDSTCWNDGAKVANPLTTVIPTGYQLITWQLNSGTANVKYMGQDRTIAKRVGGKRLCEMITFNRLLSDTERSVIEGYLKAKWWGTMSQATATFAMRVHKFGKPQVHFDASEASSFHYDVDGDTTGTKVSQWDDLSGNGRHLVTFQFDASNPKYPTRDIIHYAPALNLGSYGSALDMRLATRLTTTRAVFMVAEVDRHKRVYWLGDDTDYHFARNDATDEGAYAYGSSPIYTKGSIYRNGQKITSPKTQYPDAPGGFCVYTFNVTQNCNWQHLCRDRKTAASSSSGGKRIAELITFDTTFTDADRESLEKLLMEKWRPSEAYVDALIADAPVHVDSASSNNFTYTDGKITGWKNSGDGADLFKPETLYNENNVITCNFGGHGFTNGAPAFLMGGGDSRIDLAFTRMKNVRSMFWVMDIDKMSVAPFLGDGANNVYTKNSISDWKYQLCRGYQSGDKGTYFSSSAADKALKYGPMFCDGALVVSATTERPQLGSHVYDLTSQSDLTVSLLGVERWCVPRNGGRAISELLIFTNAVSGLTQDMIRERIAAKWTKRCGWAGAGDAEWGVDKYRVFDAAATVPAEGASAVGVGFTDSATLSGTGTLTLGDGGVFASEDTAATVSAPVAGKLGAYGPGTVNIATAPSVADSISVGYGSTLVIAAGDATVSGALSIQEGGKLVIDVSALAAKQHVVITFASFALPAGGTLYDYVSLTGNAAGHVLTIGADGLSIHVNDPSVALSAEWNATTSDDVTVAANWVCRNADGTVLPNTTLPCLRTTNVTLNADCDLRAWGTPVFEDGVRIDLKGHTLKVADLSDDDYKNATVTNSNDGATAELHVEVADGKTVTNSTVSILGDIKVSKYGLGTWRIAKTSQTYSGGTSIKEGVLANGVTDARNYLLGAKWSTVTVSTNGANKGVLELNGMFAQSKNGAEYTFVMDGGVIRNTSPDIDLSWGQFSAMQLTADSEFITTAHFGFFATATEIDLGGYTLKIAIGTNGRIFHIVNGELRNGFIDITSGGWFQTGISGNATYCKTNVADTVDFRIGSALKIFAPLSVRNYEQVYGSNNNDGTAALMVHGTFKPASHNYFYGCTMMDGSTIDLSARTTALPLSSSFTKGRKTIDFAPNANVTVSLAGRADVRTLAKNKEYVVTWTTAPGSDVKFALDAQSAQGGMRLRRDTGGLRLAFGGLVIIVK